MEKLWSGIAWDEYLYWQTQDKKTLKRINALIKDIECSYFQGIGKPEPLKYRSGWSRRIDVDNRLVLILQTEITAPGSAVPKIFTGFSRCSIICSLNNKGNLIIATSKWNFRVSP